MNNIEFNDIVHGIRLFIETQKEERTIEAARYTEWKGKPVLSMTRDELIIAFVELAQLYASVQPMSDDSE